jgi:hypothetical protein
MKAEIVKLPFIYNGAVNTTIGVAVLHMWFAYIHFWATNVFSVRSDPSLNKEKPTIIDS